jgi:hypothetical protein
MGEAQPQIVRKQSLTQSWVSFLTRFAWELFATLTFRQDVSSPVVRRLYHDFFAEIQVTFNRPFGWFAAEERGGLGRLHVHALLIGVDHIQPHEWTRMWYARAGNAQIVRYDPARGATHYCVKQLVSCPGNTFT